MAPKVEKKLRHSQIKADRWACGHVLLFLLDEFKRENKPLMANPEQRTSLLEGCSDNMRYKSARAERQMRGTSCTAVPDASAKRDGGDAHERKRTHESIDTMPSSTSEEAAYSTYIQSPY